ncbi:FMN-binding protein [Demequina soli]|uniref:FMN-binding protein n=1 Tax=Demequina soli TaxID=1638987 RepID=UPI0007835901|nr:FMN-binding protein [Demequina soli]
MTDITWLQEGESDPHSQQINSYAVPVLQDAILKAQDTNVGYVSGASFTSQAVEDAVTSAMQAAGLA